MDYATLSEVIDVTYLIVSGDCIGNNGSTVDNTNRFMENELMKLNAKKCNRVKMLKPLGLHMNDNLSWQANTGHIIKKTTKHLYILEVLKSYGATKMTSRPFIVV